VTVEGFAVGVRALHAKGFNLEPLRARGNGVGVHSTNAAGQYFYGFYEANGIGLIWEAGRPGDPVFNGLDANSNTYVHNGVAVQIGMGHARTEFGRNKITYGTGQAAFRVETAPGVFTEGDLAYHGGVACHSQFGPTTVNGIRHDRSAFTLNNGC